MIDFEEFFEDPVKLWGSVAILVAVLFYVFSGSGSAPVVATEDPFSESSSFVSQDEMGADEEPVEEETSFVEEDSLEEDDMAEAPQFAAAPKEQGVAAGAAVISMESEEGGFGGEFAGEGSASSSSISIEKTSDKKIEELSKKIDELKQEIRKSRRSEVPQNREPDFNIQSPKF